MADADWTTFLLNRAGMLAGAAIACRPTKAVTTVGSAAINIAGREVAHLAATEGAVLAKPFITNGAKQATQKSALFIEQTIAKNGINQTSKVSIIAKDVLQPNPLKGTIYRGKVLDQMRLHATTAKPDFHAFPRVVDNYAYLGRKELIFGKDGLARTKLTLPGGYNGKNGNFEWIIEANNEINHRMFLPNP